MLARQIVKVLGVLMLAGVLIRQYFVLRHKGAAKPWLPASAGLLLLGLIAWMAPSAPTGDGARADYAGVRDVLDRRCVGCHAAKPQQEGFAQPPKGIALESAEQVGQHAAKIAETVGNRYMPIGNLTRMTDDERALVARWFAAGARTNH